RNQQRRAPECRTPARRDGIAPSGRAAVHHSARSLGGDHGKQSERARDTHRGGDERMSKPMSDQSRAPTTNRAGRAALMIAMLALPATAFAASARIPAQVPAPPPANDVPSIM